MDHMFSDCAYIKKHPNIGNWNLENVEFFNNVFSNCKGLEEFIDPTKLNA